MNANCIESMLFVNGIKNKMITVTDRGIQFGDGCFTTASIRYGKILLLDLHLKRLQVACEKLNIKFSCWFQLKEEMQQVADNQKRAVLKVIITRGSNNGKGGYNFMQCAEPTRIMYILPWPNHYDNWREHGINLSLSPIRLGRNPYLAGLKHLNRLEQVLISAYLKQIPADEVLVLDSEGYIVECCTANVFWRKNNIVYTPYVNQAGVNGVMRQFCLNSLVSSVFQTVEIYANEKAISTADEVIICNSLMSVVSVKSYNRIEFSSRKLFTFLSLHYTNQNLI